nr:hypothetical protein GCM10025699_05290 [Microbacterium flavescens]
MPDFLKCPTEPGNDFRTVVSATRPTFDAAPIGVDEHVRRHTRFGDKYATAIFDLPPAREKTKNGAASSISPGLRQSQPDGIERST